jgi:hypothetical protein
MLLLARCHAMIERESKELTILIASLVVCVVLGLILLIHHVNGFVNGRNWKHYTRVVQTIHPRGMSKVPRFTLANSGKWRHRADHGIYRSASMSRLGSRVPVIHVRLLYNPLRHIVGCNVGGFCLL